MKKGFTLVEIIISILILSFVIVSVTALFMLSGRNTDTVIKTNNAEKLCMSQMEFLKSINYDSAILLNSNIENYNSINSYENFKRETFVEPFYSGDTRLLEFTVNVKWNNSFTENKLSLYGVHFCE